MVRKKIPDGIRLNIREQNNNIMFGLIRTVMIICFFLDLKGQKNDSLFLNICNTIQNNDLKKIRFHLLGEYHYKYNNDNIEMSYLKYLHAKYIYPKYIIAESGPATAYVYNKYYEIGDENLLDLLFAFTFTKNFYRNVYKYRSSLKSEQKFNVLGADYEDSPGNTHYAIRDMLLKGLRKYDNETFLKLDSCEQINSFPITGDRLWSILIGFKMKKNPNTWGDKDKKEDIKEISTFFKSQDSTSLIKILQDSLQEFRLILNAYEAPLNDKKIYSNKKMVLRDKYMAENMYKTFIRDTSVTMLGQLGSAHVPKKYQKNWSDKSVACFLNSDTTFNYLNNKVYSNIIVYKTFHTKLFKFLGINKHDKKEVFSKMKQQNCEAYIQKYKDSTVIDNLIFLKNKRQKIITIESSN